MEKYTPQDISRIFEERIEIRWIEAKLKAGTIAEWTFEYPNGNKTSQIEFSYPMDEANADETIGKKVVMERIKDKLWAICGQYTLATGELL